MHLTSYFFSIFREYKTRYIACIIGFGVALGAVFAVNAYTSLLDDTVQQFYFIDDNSFMVLAKGSNVLQIIPFDSEIPDNVSNALEEEPGVVMTVPMIFKEFGNESQFKYFKDTIVGIDITQLQEFYLDEGNLKEGRYPEQNQSEVIIGNLVGNQNVGLGDTIPIRNQNFTVVGILAGQNPLIDRFIFLDFDLAQTTLEYQNTCSIIYGITDGTSFQESNALTLLEYKLDDEYPMINIVDEQELDESVGFFYQILDAISGILSSFPLIISGFFILVMMILNIKDQEREFGMLRAIGIPLRKIGLIVFFQSIFIGVLGYLLSIFIGNFYFIYGFYVFFGDNANLSVWEYIAELRQQIPLNTYSITLLLSFFISCLIAIYPVYRATRKSIVQTFRKEE